MKITIRHLVGEEMLEALYTLNSYSLHPSPPLQNKEEWMSIVRERQGMNCHALFEDDTPVSVAVSTPMTQNMRGKIYPASGVWGVSTFPSARRKGYCRQVMASVLSSERDSGKVFTNLYPFRESFYERLGYVSFPLTKIARINTHSQCSWAWGADWERLRDAFWEGYSLIRTLPIKQWEQLDLFVATQFTTMVLWSSALLMNDPKRVAEYVPWREDNGNRLLGYFNR